MYYKFSISIINKRDVNLGAYGGICIAEFLHIVKNLKHIDLRFR